MLYARGRVLSAVALACSLVLLASAGFAGQGLIRELLDRQQGLSTVRATFVQKKHTAMLERPILSTGTFSFKLGRGVRWEYEDVLVVYDGNVLYVYSPEMQEAEKIMGKEGFMGPLAFDVKQLAKDYDMEARDVGGAISLELRPREDMPFATMTMMFPRGSAFPTEVTITEETGDRTTIEFGDIDINGRLDDDIFTFTPPPGTVVRERSIE